MQPGTAPINSLLIAISLARFIVACNVQHKAGEGGIPMTKAEQNWENCKLKGKGQNPKPNNKLVLALYNL